MCDIVFNKSKGRDGLVNKTSVYAEGFFKRGVMRNLTEFRGKHLCRNLLIDKVKLCRLVRLF